MVTILQERCTACGACVRICHERCMRLEDGKIEIDAGTCSTCGQCIAVCPSQALRWDGTEAAPFDTARFPAPEQVDELLKRRRTVRLFKTDPPDRSLVEETIAFGAYAPTHRHDFRVVAVDDPELLALIDRTVYDNNRKLYRYVFDSPLVRLMLPLMPLRVRGEFMKAKPKLERSLEIGRAYACMPPVMLFIVATRGVPLSNESAQYVLHNINLYAMTRGLGCRNLVGNQMFLNRSRKLRNSLGLSRNERIFATLGVGYPAVRYRNKVEGRTMDVQWVGR